MKSATPVRAGISMSRDVADVENVRVQSSESHRNWEFKSKFKLYKTAKNNAGASI